MDCERFAPYLAGYAGNDLRSDTSRLVAAHLGGCQRCSDEVARQSQVVGALRGMRSTVIAPPLELVEDILATVGGHQSLGGIAASMPLSVVERVRKVTADPRVRGAAGQISEAGKQVAGKLTDPKARAAAAAGTAAVAGGIFALVSRRRRLARGAATA